MGLWPGFLAAPAALAATSFATDDAGTASMVRRGMDDSTNTAGMRRAAMNCASACTSAVPASEAVLMPCSPRTWNPYARPK